MSVARGNSGGAAAAGGMDFQHRVAAWLAVRILAEEGAAPLWDLSMRATLEFIRCETGQPVDDILIGTAEPGFAFIQVKRSLGLSEDPKSDFASVLDQFARQFVSNRTSQKLERAWERPLDPSKDRLVLIVGPTSSASIRVNFAQLLARIRGLSLGQPLEDAAQNQAQERALTAARDHSARAWEAMLGRAPSPQELTDVLSLIRVQTLDVEDGGGDERAAKDLLSATILTPDAEAGEVWKHLIAECARLATERSGADRRALQELLMKAGVALKAARSYHDDIERLQAYSKTTVHLLANYSRIRLKTGEVKIARSSTLELLRAAQEESVLVVGQPGAGKSGALHDLAETAVESRDVIFLAADRLSATSLPSLRMELGLEHELKDVLGNWHGTKPGLLVIDALDAARADPAARMLRDLIDFATPLTDRWRVVASIRKFDLRHGAQFRALFQGQPVADSGSDLCDGEFRDVRHLNVPLLSSEELEQVGRQSPPLRALITKAAGAPRGIGPLLRVPFNLRIAAELLDEDVAVDDLTPIETRLGLLERYWEHRVVRSDGLRDAREAVLRHACERMAASRTLRASRAQIADPTNSAVIHDLLSCQVLSEDDRNGLAFSHHVLFDYAAARLLLRDSSTALTTRLAEDPDIALFLGPSLLFHFEYLWVADSTRQEFWDTVSDTMSATGVPEIAKLLGPSAAVDLAKGPADLAPLVASLSDADARKRSAAARSFQHLIGSLMTRAPNELVGSEAGPWCALLEATAAS